MEARDRCKVLTEVLQLLKHIAGVKVCFSIVLNLELLLSVPYDPRHIHRKMLLIILALKNDVSQIIPIPNQLLELLSKL